MFPCFHVFFFSIYPVYLYVYFRYSRIEDEDDDLDDECMESNFADLEKEEYNSLVTG